jgi:hypothetical protein
MLVYLSRDHIQPAFYVYSLLGRENTLKNIGGLIPKRSVGHDFVLICSGIVYRSVLSMLS